MKVRIISYSQSPTIEFTKKLEYWWPTPNGVREMVGSKQQDLQDLIAYCARVSNPSNQNNKKTSGKLIKYLIKNQHWSPLEMVSACLEIETTRDIARQILRHRSFSFQEFSQRYADPALMEAGNDLDFELREARLQDETNRQNSIETDDYSLQEQWEIHQAEVISVSESAYNWAVDNGIALEQARVVLPEGLTKSKMYMNGTLRSWIHYISLRSGNGTQKEHMEIARAVAEVITKVFPLAEEYVN